VTVDDGVHSARISLSFVTCMINNCTRIHIFFLEPPAPDFDGIFVRYCRGVVHTSFRMATWSSCWERGVKDSNCQHNEKVQDFLWLKQLDFKFHVFSNSPKTTPPLTELAHVVDQGYILPFFSELETQDSHLQTVFARPTPIQWNERAQSPLAEL
jgi:hypothetical protein